MTSNTKKTDDPLILLGVIVAAHGIKGDVLVRTFTNVPEDVTAYGPLTDSKGARIFDLMVKRNTKKGLICRIAGVDDRNQAEAIKGTELFVNRDQLPAPEDGAFYFADLIGLNAVSTDGTAIGHVINVMNHGAGDILEIKLCNSGQTELVPFLDAYVPSINVGAGTIVIVLPTPAPDDNVNGDGPAKPAS